MKRQMKIVFHRFIRFSCPSIEYTCMERMPCGQFEANALFFAIGVLAYNLYKMFTGQVLPGGFGRRQVQSVRYAFYSMVGKVVSTGGQLWLKVSPAHFDFFSRVRRAILRIQSG